MPHTLTSARRAAAVVTSLLGIGILLSSGVAATAAGTITGTGQSNLLVAADESPITTGSFPRDSVVSADGSKIFIANTAGDSVTVYDAAGLITGTVSTGDQPNAIAMSPDGTRVYTTNYTGNSITEIDATTGTLVATTVINGFPQDLVVSPDGTRLYVAGSNVRVYALPGLALLGTVTTHQNPNALAITPDGSEVYVSAGAFGWVDIIDTSDLLLPATSIDVLGNPYAITVAPDGRTVYAVDNTNDMVYPIDIATHALGTGFATADFPTSIAVSADSQWIYITTNPSLMIVSANDPTQFSLLPHSNGYGLDVSEDGRKVVMTRSSFDQALVFNVPHLTVAGTDSIDTGTPSTTFTVSMNDGNTPVGDYSGGDVTIQIRNGSNVVMASSSPASLDAATGLAEIAVPTAALTADTYSIEAAWSAGGVPMLAVAPGFVVAPGPVVSAALPATGAEAGAATLSALALLLVGGGLLAWRPRRAVVGSK